MTKDEAEDRADFAACDRRVYSAYAHKRADGRYCVALDRPGHVGEMITFHTAEALSNWLA